MLDFDTMKLYRVKDWAEIYENNRTRELARMAWVPIPNKHDGDGYTALVDRENGAAVLGGWLAILQVASKCDVRGTLLRDGQKPHDAQSIARMTRLPASVIQEALDVCSNEIQWLEVIELAQVPQEGAGIPQEGAVKSHPTDYRTEGKGTERTEGREGNAPSREDFQDVPDLEQAKAAVMSDGIPEDFIALAHADWIDNGGRNAKGMDKPWPAYVRTRWRYEAGDWKAGTHRGKSSAAKKSIGPRRSEVIAYAKEKGDEHGVFGSSFHHHWSLPQRDWKRNGVLIDWKVEFSKCWGENRPEAKA